MYTIRYNMSGVKRVCFFKYFVKESVLIAPVNIFGKLFQLIVVPESIMRFPYHTYFSLCGAIDVVLENIKGQFGWY